VLVRVRPGAPTYAAAQLRLASPPKLQRRRARGTNFDFANFPRVPLSTRLAHVTASGGQAALDFTPFPGASSSRRLILQMEDAARVIRAQTLR
jgi:hypothetical protein